MRAPELKDFLFTLFNQLKVAPYKSAQQQLGPVVLIRTFALLHMVHCCWMMNTLHILAMPYDLMGIRNYMAVSGIEKSVCATGCTWTLILGW